MSTRTIRSGLYRYVVFKECNDFALMGWDIGPMASEWSAFAWACMCNPEGKKVPYGSSHYGRNADGEMVGSVDAWRACDPTPGDHA